MTDPGNGPARPTGPLPGSVTVEVRLDLVTRPPDACSPGPKPRESRPGDSLAPVPAPLRRLLNLALRRRARPDDQPATGSHPKRATYPGDFTGVARPEYGPDLDGQPDPGEIVWTWVPYEEDHSRGKDRPVLVVGRDGPWLLTLMLTSKDHDTRPARRDETWVDIGSGSWDAERRASEVRVDRVIRADPAAVRREGAILDRQRFDVVVGSLPAVGG